MSESNVFLKFWKGIDVENFGARPDGGVNFPVTGFPLDIEIGSKVIVPFGDGRVVHGTVIGQKKWTDGIVFDIRVDPAAGNPPRFTYTFKLKEGIDIEPISALVIEYEDVRVQA